MCLKFVDSCIIVKFIKKSNMMHQCIKIILVHIYMKLNIFRMTPPIMRSLKLHWQPLVFYAWNVVVLVNGGRCQAQCAWQCPPSTRPTTFNVWKTRGCQCSSRLLMMGGVSPEKCWASYKYGIIKFWYTVASCWVFLYELCILYCTYTFTEISN